MWCHDTTLARGALRPLLDTPAVVQIWAIEAICTGQSYRRLNTRQGIGPRHPPVRERPRCPNTPRPTLAPDWIRANHIAGGPLAGRFRSPCTHQTITISLSLESHSPDSYPRCPPSSRAFLSRNYDRFYESAGAAFLPIATPETWLRSAGMARRC